MTKVFALSKADYKIARECPAKLYDHALKIPSNTNGTALRRTSMLAEGGGVGWSRARMKDELNARLCSHVHDELRYNTYDSLVTEKDMQTKIALDEKLIKRAQEITGIKAKSEAVQEALRALFAMQKKAEADHPVENSRPQEAVVKSLERSLVENAELWSELAKH
jgi:Arc/MetJ family transcription regulator